MTSDKVWNVGMKGEARAGKEVGRGADKELLPQSLSSLCRVEVTSGHLCRCLEAPSV